MTAMRKDLLATAVAAAMLVGGAQSASALEIKSSDVHPMGYPTTDAIEYMGQLLDTWTSGRMKIKIFHSMQLGGEKEALEQVQVGALEMTRVSVGVVGPIVEDFNAFNLPYFFRSVDHMHKVVDGEIGTELLNKLEKGGLIGLGYMDAGSRSFYNKERPIKTLDDLNGLKIRVMQNPIFVEMVNAMGGNGLSVAFNELYTAMQTGVVDGAERIEQLGRQRRRRTSHSFGFSGFVWLRISKCSTGPSSDPVSPLSAMTWPRSTTSPLLTSNRSQWA